MNSENKLNPLFRTEQCSLIFRPWKNNSIRFIFIIISAVFLIFFRVAAIPLIILTYILLSLLTAKKK